MCWYAKLLRRCCWMERRLHALTSSPHVWQSSGCCSGLLGWLSSLQPCFCLRLLQDHNYTKLSSIWPSVAMEMHGSLDYWCASTHMSQSESIILIHLVCTPLLQTWHLRATWFPSLTTEVLQKEKKIEGKRNGLYKIAWDTGVLHIFCVELRSSCCCYSAVTYFLPVRLCWLTYDI